LLLDITMPGEDGLDLLADLRARAIGVPTLFLTARQEVEDRVRGLELGADDYLVKPFAFEELLARIRAIVRRRESAPVIERGPLRVDPARHVVHHGTQRVELSPREFGLLVALLDARGAVVR
jgi:DNA-binding response OmpR family regulator